MKIYTEEQVRIALDLSAKGIDLVLCDDILSYVKHIELPSDKEIMYMSLPKKGGSHSSDYMEGFNKGAKWVIEQIKQQENGK